MISGANGSGKTSLINAICRYVDYSGKILFEGQDISKIKNKQYAKNVAFVLQKNYINFDFTVKEIVEIGRYSYSKNARGTLTKDDHDCINKALQYMNISDIADKSVQKISGGQLQRCLIAQVLAQDSDVIVLDEPANNLDIAYIKNLFEILTDQIKNKNKTIISVAHDISLAKAYASHALLLKDGKTISVGAAKEALSNDNLKTAYNLDVKSYLSQINDNLTW